MGMLEKMNDSKTRHTNSTGLGVRGTDLGRLAKALNKFPRYGLD
jgi:hypothetical protein